MFEFLNSATLFLNSRYCHRLSNVSLSHVAMLRLRLRQTVSSANPNESDVFVHFASLRMRAAHASTRSHNASFKSSQSLRSPNHQNMHSAWYNENTQSLFSTYISNFLVTRVLEEIKSVNQINAKEFNTLFFTCLYRP